MSADDRRKSLTMNNKSNLNTKDYCPKCECLWEDHDFGVPEPYCPGPIVNQEAAQRSKEQLEEYYRNKTAQLRDLIKKEND